MDDTAKWLIWAFVGLGVAWFLTGGPEREIARQGVFLRPLAPIDSGQAYGGGYINSLYNNGKTELRLPKNAINLDTIEEDISAFAEKIKEAELIHKSPLSLRPLVIDGFSGAQLSDPQKEYLRIVASTKNTGSFTLTGIKIKSTVTNKEIVIPQGVSLPILGSASKNEKISLVPGERAFVSTGRSPIGESFKVNICSGYLGQFQTYTPELRQECPEPLDELKASGIDEEACTDFVKKIPRCSIYTKNIPSTLSKECSTFVQTTLNYNGCVASHKNDTSFFRNEWRLFLSNATELWKEKREIIKILDSKNTVLDAITY